MTVPCCIAPWRHRQNFEARLKLKLAFVMLIERTGNLQSAFNEIALAYRLDPRDSGVRADYDRLRTQVKP
jgi:hypothetical protein